MTTTRKKYTQRFRNDAVEFFLASDLPITGLMQGLATVT